MSDHMLDHNSAPIPEPRATPPVDIGAFANPDFSDVRALVEEDIEKLFRDGDVNEDFDYQVAQKVLLAMYGRVDTVRIRDRVRRELGR